MSNDVVKAVNRAPVISADQMQHVGRFANGVVLAVFEMIGGVDRMRDWADANPTDYYTKLFPKIMTKTAQVEHSGTVTLDDAISRLESQRSVDVVDAEWEEIPVQKGWDL